MAEFTPKRDETERVDDLLNAVAKATSDVEIVEAARRFASWKPRPQGSPVSSVGDIELHRNGVGGAPFYVVRFVDEETVSLLVGVVFDEEYTTAVIDPLDLKRRFRGDVFDPELRRAIAAWEEAKDA